MSTLTSTREARRRARIVEAEAQHSAAQVVTRAKEAEAQRYALSIVSESALSALGAIGKAEARRIPSALAALAGPADVATDTLLALSETDNGRRALHALSIEARGSAAHCAAEAVARMTARRSVSNMLRAETVSESTDSVIRRSALTTVAALQGQRPTIEAEAVRAAIEADGPLARIDRDHGRSFALSTAGAHGYAAGKLSAWNAAPDETRGRAGREAEAEAGAKSERAAVKSERRNVRTIREQTTARAIRIVREQDLASMLDQSLRAAPDRVEVSTSGRTLTALVDTREAGAAFRRTLRTALDSVAATLSTRGIQALRTALSALHSLTHAEAEARALSYIEAAHSARDAADSAAEAAPAFRRGMTQQERSARDAASTAQREAERVEAVAALAVSLAEVRAQRPLSLLDVVEAALTSAADNGRRTGGARARGSKGEAGDATTLDTGAMLSFLALGARDSNGARALSTVLRHAADVALDAAGAVTLPMAQHSAIEAAHAVNIEAALLHLAHGRYVLAARRTHALRGRVEAQRAAIEAAGDGRAERGRYVPEALSPAQREAAPAIVAALCAVRLA